MGSYLVREITGAGAIDEVIENSGTWLLDEVRIHLQAASGTSENLVTRIDAGRGHQYDAILDTQDMNTLADYVFLPTRPHHGLSGDKIRVTWDNTNTVEYGLVIIWRSAG